MLKLCNIVKNYPTATTTVHALRGVSVEFREHEFVAILGPSGCGKTTMLNIIGGLDRYTSGDLIIGGISTASFDDLHWDAYRNATIGFVFQSYNLIPHLTVLENVELALSLSGEKKKSRRAKSIAALNRVGMAEHINKRPNQLSGGQMQRVAIARAIVNDPKIILADEPTGALDSELSVQVMEILQEISNNCLVIMVTHNAELAAEYATRTCRFKDGLLVEDTNPFVSHDSNLDGDEVEGEAHVEANADESVSEHGNAEFEELTTDTVSVQEEVVDAQEAHDTVAIEDAAHTVEPAAEVDYDALSADDDDEEHKSKKVSNRKRKKQMRNMRVDTREIFDKLGLNGLSKHKKKIEKKNKTFKPTSMSAGMAFGLSIRNLISKRRRTSLTAFAGSIGIIGLGLVLSISNGFNVFVDKMQTEMMAGVPLGMYEYNVEVSALMDVMANMMQAPAVDENAFPDSDKLSVVSGSMTGNKDVFAVLSSLFKSVSRNDLTEEFDQYLRNMPRDYYSVYNPFYGVQYNIIAKELQSNGTFKYLDKSKKPEVSSAITITTSIIGESGVQPPNWQVLVGDEQNMLKAYDMLGGRYPQSKEELLLCVGTNNEISLSLLEDFGIGYVEDGENVSLLVKNADGTVGHLDTIDIDFFLNNPMSIRLVSNNDYYIADDTPGSSLFYLPSQDSEDLEKLYNKGTELKIVGVIRPKKDQETSYVNSAICYTPELAEFVVNEAYESAIAKAQRDLMKKETGAVATHTTVFASELKDDEITENTQIINLITSAKLEWTSHLKAIGATKAPTYINIYPETYTQKENAAKYISAWNDEHDGSVGYLDVSEMTVYTLHMLIDLMSIILIAIASISLVVSTVMIGVITSNSVIERTREIGILRSLGARKRDIRNVFVAETSLLGLASGIIGIVVTYILCPIISLIIGAVSGVGDLLHFHPLHAFLLVMASLALTVISGVMPAIGASRKNVVDALRVD